jgi:hypothetical protein
LSQENFLFKIHHRTFHIIKYFKYLKGTTKRNLETLPKIINKLSEHQINQSERKLSQKSLFSVNEPKIREGYPTEFIPEA